MEPSITQAFILGAGLGTRLRPLTDVRPKPLIPVFQDPLVVHTMRRLRNLGIKRFIINTHHLPHVWEEIFPDGTWEDCTLHFQHEPVLLDTGGGLKNIADLLDMDAPLIIHNGDIISDIPLAELIEAHARSGASATLGLRSTGDTRNVGFDPASGRVTDMRHALGVDPGTYQFTGIYCVRTADILPLIPDGEIISIVPTLLGLIRRGQVHGLIMDQGDWMDLGTQATYIAAHHTPVPALPSSSCIRISPSACVEGAELNDHCVVGAHATVGAGSRLSSCIVWPGVRVPENTRADSTVFLPPFLNSAQDSAYRP